MAPNSNPQTEREGFNAGLTVGELREQLAIFDADAELYIGGLRFNRLKMRGSKLVSLEFHEVVFREADGSVVVWDLDRE